MWIDKAPDGYYGMNDPNEYGFTQLENFIPANGAPCPQNMDFNICKGNWWTKQVRQ